MSGADPLYPPAMISLWLALSSASLAQDDPSVVFVSEFQPVNNEAAGIAALLTSYVAMELGMQPELSVRTSDQAPDLGEHSAMVYLLSCPPGQYLGCAYVVGDTVDAQYAVAGTVESISDTTTLVHVSIIDIYDSREAVSFDVELGVGDDQQFVELVADMLVAVAEGEAGQLVDERDFGDGDDPRSQDARIARQLEALAGEMGQISDLSTRDRAIERPEYTMEDLVEDGESDSAPPWEQLGMSPQQYLRFKNSGMTVNEWNKVQAGRRGQIILAGGLGYARGPVSSEYRGWYVIDPDTQQNLATSAWQARTLSSGGGGQLWAGYGLTPWLEVDAGFGLIEGRYAMQIQQEIDGEDVIPRDGQDFPQSNFLLSGRVLAAPFPAWPGRPLIGVGFTWMTGEGNAQNLNPGEGTGLPSFPGAGLGLATLTLGGEFDLGERVGIWAQVPVSAVVVGGEVMEETWGVTTSIQSYQSPGAVPSFSTGIEVGVRVRLLGKVQETERDWELPD